MRPFNYGTASLVEVVLCTWAGRRQLSTATLTYLLTYKFLGGILSKFFMVILVFIKPVASPCLHIWYIMKNVQFRGTAVERYKMKKILQLAESSMMVNNCTSVLDVTYNPHSNTHLTLPTKSKV